MVPLMCAILLVAVTAKTEVVGYGTRNGRRTVQLRVPDNTTVSTRLTTSVTTGATTKQRPGHTSQQIGSSLETCIIQDQYVTSLPTFVGCQLFQ